MGIEYTGDWLDETYTVGTFTAIRVAFDHCVFCMIPQEPSHIFIDDAVSNYTVGSENLSGSIDAGHLLYIAHENSAYPTSVVISNIRDSYGQDSALKIRKGDYVAVTNVVVYMSGRGMDISYVKTAVVTNVNVKIKDMGGITGDSLQYAIQCANSGTVMLSNVVADVTGASAYGLSIRATTPPFPEFQNQFLSVSHYTTIFDNTNTRGGTIALKAPFYISEHSGAFFDNIRALHKGSIAGIAYPIRVENVTNCVFFRPIHEAPDGPSDAYKLISLDSNCYNNRVTYMDNDLSVAVISTTTTNSGTGNQITRLGYGNYQGNIVSASSGTEAAPAHTFLNSQQTGLYLTGGGNLGFTISGLTVAAIQNSAGTPIGYLGGDSNTKGFRAVGGANVVNYIEAIGGNAGLSPRVRSRGSDTNVQISIDSQGTGDVALRPNATPQLTCSGTTGVCTAATGLAAPYVQCGATGNCNVRIGSASGVQLIGTSTNGFPRMPTITGLSTAVPSGSEASSAEYYWRVDTKQLCIRDSATSAWLCSAVFT